MNNGSTIDVEVYEQTGNGAVGADLCTTAAESWAADDTWYTKDFVVTAAGLVAGDILKVYGNSRLMGTVPTCVISHALDLCVRCHTAYALELGSTCAYCEERRQAMTVLGVSATRGGQ